MTRGGLGDDNRIRMLGGSEFENDTARSWLMVCNYVSMTKFAVRTAFVADRTFAGSPWLCLRNLFALLRRFRSVWFS